MRARLLGIVVGLLLAAAVISTSRPAPPGVGAYAGRILSECDGAIRSIVIQYCAGAEFTHETYRQFLRALPSDVSVYVLCPSSQEYDVLQETVSPVQARLIPIVVAHPITCWSRDRWIVLKNQRKGSLLLCPQAEEAAAVWPLRQGDQRVAFDLADYLRSAAPHANVRAVRAEIDFDGGDFLADGENVFVTPAVARRNLGRAVSDLESLRRILHDRLGGKIVLLDDAPDHHAGMFMASAGGRTMLVGDLRLGREMERTISPALLEELPGGPDFSETTQRRFDRVAEQAATLGYRVIRIPTLCSADAKTYLTYVNGIIDHRTGQKRVYMPIYQGAEAMNAAAERVWRQIGYDVTPIDCTGVFPHFGTLHCLVNLLERS